MAKKIGAIVSLSIIGILIIATIIMANVNVNYGIKCESPSSVWVQKGTETKRLVQSEDDANQIVNIIANASKEKSLTALFNGTLNKKPNVVVASSVGKTLPTDNSFYVRYYYNNPQKLMDGKKEYKDANGNAVYYDELVFTVNNVEGTNVFNVYVIQDATNSNVYNYYYELEADFSELYSLLNEKFN